MPIRRNYLKGITLNSEWEYMDRAYMCAECLAKTDCRKLGLVVHKSVATDHNSYCESDIHQGSMHYAIAEYIIDTPVIPDMEYLKLMEDD